MATSYNGWAASPVPAAIGIAPFSVLGTKPFKDGGFPVGLKGGDVSTVFRHLVTRLHNEVEPMMIDPDSGLIGYGCWAYQYRANVNNPSVLSCHASGTAIDYNAPRHPNGTSVGANGGGGWTAAQAAKIRGILADLGGVVRWLTSNDPMHFEIAASEAAVAAVATRLSRDPGKPGTPNIPPDNPANDTEWWFDMATDAQKQEFKQLVRDAFEWAEEEGDGSSIDPVLIRRGVRGAILNAANGGDPELLQALKEIVRDGAMWARNDDPNAGDQAGK